MSDHLSQLEITGFDALPEARRESALDHLGGCTACRVNWLAEDPARVFSLLGGAPIDEQRLDELSARVSAAVDALEPVPVPRRSWGRVASIAASLVLAVGLGAVLWNQQPVQTAVALPIDILPAALEEELAGMELVTSPGDDARVLTLDLGETTQVLMIFDEAIEL